MGAADRLEQYAGARLAGDNIDNLGAGEPRDGGSLRLNISCPMLGIGGSSPGGEDALRFVPPKRPKESSSLSRFIPDVSSIGKSLSSAVLPWVEAISSVAEPLLALRARYGETASPTSLGDRYSTGMYAALRGDAADVGACSRIACLGAGCIGNERGAAGLDKGPRVDKSLMEALSPERRGGDLLSIPRLASSFFFRFES